MKFLIIATLLTLPIVGGCKNPPQTSTDTQLAEASSDTGKKSPEMDDRDNLTPGCSPPMRCASPYQSRPEIRVERDAITLNGEHIQSFGADQSLLVEASDASAKDKFLIESLAQSLRAWPDGPPTRVSVKLHPLTSYQLLASVIFTLTSVKVQAQSIDVFERYEQLGMLAKDTQLIDLEIPQSPLNNDEDLRVHIYQGGYNIMVADGLMTPAKGCPDPGPSICLRSADSEEIQSLIDAARRAYEAGDGATGASLLAKMRQQFPLEKLYDILADIKRRSPDQTQISLNATLDLPALLLVDVAHLTRVELPEQKYSTLEALYDAYRASEPDNAEPLFPHLVFAVVK